ncbi:MAG: hypothetical protein ABIK44_07865, partial [candidate division WOR-3 bacterium]
MPDRLFLVTLTILSISVPTCALTWTETTQRDFNDGSFESHIYASYRAGGAVEFTNPFDLNNDGFIDVACP